MNEFPELDTLRWSVILGPSGVREEAQSVLADALLERGVFAETVMISNEALREAAMRWACTGLRCVALHRCDLKARRPQKIESQHDYEVSYDGYRRARVEAGDLSVQGSVITNLKAVEFPICIGAGELVTHISLGNGNNAFLYAPLAIQLHIVNGMKVCLQPGNLVIDANRAAASDAFWLNQL